MEDLEEEIKKADADVAQKTTSLTAFIEEFNNMIIDKNKDQKQANILKFQTRIEQIKIDNSVLIAANNESLRAYLKAINPFFFNADGKTVNPSVIGKFIELFGDATYFKTIFNECFVPVYNRLNQLSPIGTI